jgi:hypothetical protein
MNVKSMHLFAGAYFLLSSYFCLSQTLTNKDVVQMQKAGLSASIIELKVANSPCQFDTSIAALTDLKSSGVEDPVIAAMLHCAPAKPVHDRPYVWIGANEEWVARSSSVASATATSSTAVATGGSKTVVQTHSEYSDVTRQLGPDKCPSISITGNPADADYAITIERSNAGHLLSQRNSFSIFRASDGKLVLSNTTTWLKNAAANMCKAVTDDAVAKWPSINSPQPGGPPSKESVAASRSQPHS